MSNNQRNWGYFKLFREMTMGWDRFLVDYVPTHSLKDRDNALKAVGMFREFLNKIPYGLVRSYIIWDEHRVDKYIDRFEVWFKSQGGLNVWQIVPQFDRDGHVKLIVIAEDGLDVSDRLGDYSVDDINHWDDLLDLMPDRENPAMGSNWKRIIVRTNIKDPWRESALSPRLTNDQYDAARETVGAWGRKLIGQLPGLVTFGFRIDEHGDLACIVVGMHTRAYAHMGPNATLFVELQPLGDEVWIQQFVTYHYNWSDSAIVYAEDELLTANPSEVTGPFLRGVMGVDMTAQGLDIIHEWWDTQQIRNALR